jgi:transposase
VSVRAPGCGGSTNLRLGRINVTVTQKRRPTIQAVFETVKREGVNFTGKINSLRNLVKKLGFRWKKTENKQVLIEKPEIKFKRIEYW